MRGTGRDISKINHKRVKREKGRENVEFKSVRKMSGTMKDDTEKRVKTDRLLFRK